jgi:hypothetical protein
MEQARTSLSFLKKNNCPLTFRRGSDEHDTETRAGLSVDTASMFVGTDDASLHLYREVHPTPFSLCAATPANAAR